METVTKLICTNCHCEIEPEKGKIVQGNIYMIDEDIEKRGGLIGGGNVIENNTPFVEVRENAFCDRCLKELLNLECPYPHPRDIS